MRRKMTPEEGILWSKLRANRLSGYKFRRQVPIHRFIVDFVCFEKKLIVELDGECHQNTQDYDRERTEWFQRRGYRVLRFRNEEVYKSIENVLNTILKHLKIPVLKE